RVRAAQVGLRLARRPRLHRGRQPARAPVGTHAAADRGPPEPTRGTGADTTRGGEDDVTRTDTTTRAVCALVEQEIGQKHERELERETEAMRRVVDAAVAWWRSTRPVGWGDEAHLQHPLIALKALDAPGLARAVADYVAAHGHKTEDA